MSLRSWLLGDSLAKLGRIRTGGDPKELAAVAQNMLLAQAWAESEAVDRESKAEAQRKQAEREAEHEAERDAAYERRRDYEERQLLIDAQRKNELRAGSRDDYMDAYPTENSSVDHFLKNLF